MDGDPVSTDGPAAETIFCATLELEVEERSAYLARACGDNEPLRNRVEALLRAHEGAPRFLPESPAAATFDSLPANRIIGDYELLEEIARGGMGVVYRARQRSLDRIVAVKMILAGQFASREQALRFRAEAEAAARLQHPNIVRIHETGEHEGRPYFSMDYVAGPNLGALVHEKPLPARRAAACVKTIAEAIHYAHELGILHRDLKPSNILLDASDQPHITDFGLAKRVTKESLLTVTGEILGSPSFMPPEQAGAKGVKAGRYSDVYSLGGILFYLVTGRAPFVVENVAETLHHVLNTEPVSPRLLNLSVPPDIATICLKCLEKVPNRRYQTAQQLADELERFLNDEPIHAWPASRAQKLWRWCRRNPVVASLGSATLVLLIAVAVGSPIAAYRIHRERVRAEKALEKEAALRQQAEGREKLARAQVLCDQLRFDEARELMGRIPPVALITERKDAGIVFRALTDSCARQGRWKEAVADAIKTVEVEPAEHMNHVSLVVLLAANGDLEKYQSYCRDFLERFRGSKEPIIGERIAKACLMLPSSGVDLALAEKFAEDSLREGIQRKSIYHAYNQFTRGLAEYRQGRFASASDWMRRSIADPFYGDGHMRYVQSYMVLAMAQNRLEQYEEARAAFAKGVEIAETKLPKLEAGDLGPGWHWKDWIIAHALMKEAKALMEAPLSAADTLKPE